MLSLTPEQNLEFEKSETFHICRTGNFIERNPKVRDHWHLTGRFRGAAHRKCNFKYQEQDFVPVVLHNLSSYDGHLIVKCLSYDNNQIDVIAKSEEKYLTFTKYMPLNYFNKINFKIRFIDSFSFLNSSLASLAESLPLENFMKLRNILGRILN